MYCKNFDSINARNDFWLEQYHALMNLMYTGGLFSWQARNLMQALKTPSPNNFNDFLFEAIDNNENSHE